jgi:beta-lactamase regulating signal transducer with metallopeptidase domain
MTLADQSFWANHLWQSTLFVLLAWLLTLCLRRNGAAVRYRLWLAASVKFLVPFSLLVSIGSRIEWRCSPALAQPRFANVMNEIGRPLAFFTGTSSLAGAPQARSLLPMILLGVWLSGAVLGLIFWLRSLRQIRAARRAATALPLYLPIPVMSSPARLGPGVSVSANQS